MATFVLLAIVEMKSRMLRFSTSEKAEGPAYVSEHGDVLDPGPSHHGIHCINLRTAPFRPMEHAPNSTGFHDAVWNYYIHAFTCREAQFINCLQALYIKLKQYAVQLLHESTSTFPPWIRYGDRKEVQPGCSPDLPILCAFFAFRRIH
jgi:hypothetical protein